MKRSDATRLGIALGILVLIAVPVALLSGGGDEGKSKLSIIRTTGEVVVSLDDPRVNRPGTAGGRSTVQLTCVDRNGKAIAGGQQPWPWRDDAGLGAGSPHIHQSVPPQLVASIASCRVEGTKPKLEGKVDDS